MAYYYINFYVGPEVTSIDKLTEQIIGSLIESGCSFSGIWAGGKLKKTSLDKAKLLMIKDAKKMLAKKSDTFASPQLELLFECNFKFDPSVSREMGGNGKEVSFKFFVERNKLHGEKVIIDLNTREEYVLMYGEEKTHLYNKLQIMKIAEKVYTKVSPYFGWMDGELNSNDESFEPFMKGKVPTGNEFVFIGKKLIKKLNMNKLKKTDAHWEKLPDGGILIQNWGKSILK